jgi:Sel1 repeat
MKRAAFRAIFCCATLLASSLGAAADPAFDRDMANRYMQVAQSGDDDAAFYLGALYSAGVGVQQSDQEAFRWFMRAADQGHSHAMLIVSGLYAIGRGVQKDNVKAYQYAYIVSSATKVDEFRNGSRQLMGVLETRMTPEEVNLARGDASRWHATGRATQVSVPTNTGLRPPAPPQPPQPPQVTSNPPPPPPPPAATTTTTTAPQGSTPLKPVAKADDTPKKSDVDNLLDQVPPNLRKKFGF